jgi:hypothetical protein
MTTYQGTYKAYPFRMTSKTSGSPDISSWTFHAKIRDKLTSAVLLDLTSANGGVVVTDGLNGRLELRMTAVQTATLPVARLLFDVLRTDAVPGPVWLFGGAFKVKTPVTR